MRDLFCEKCGRRLDEDDLICPLCRTVIKKPETEVDSEVRVPNKSTETADVEVSEKNVPVNGGKSRFVAGFLQIFLGALGIGRFYLGYNTIGALQIVASFFTCGLGGFVWGFIDGVCILMGRPQADANGKALAD